ncbi:MAG: 5'-methylthioadenosine/S-adenosylhomocysteine nucleosidase [Aeriscardovia sp.]|nr:5'-methylthioadenosine/S-adenosylhomocysteine nucleosidase [Aeriscardovia sp.]
MKVAVLGAMEEEVELLKSSLEDLSSFSGAGMEVFEGRRNGIEVACARSGMGLVAAAAATQFLIDSVAPGFLIFSGIAGALRDGCGIGEVIVGEKVRFLDADMELICQDNPHLSEFSSDPRLVKTALKALEELKIPHAAGILASSNRFIGSAEAKEKARKDSGADGAEMEGGAFLQICAKNGLPALVLRTVSDGSSMEYSSFHHFDTSSYSRQSNRVVLKMLEILSPAKVGGRL